MPEIPNPLTNRKEESSEDKKRYADESGNRQAQLRAALRLNTITGIGALVSLAGLFAVFINLRLTSHAVEIADTQAKTAQSEFLMSQRPWVFISGVQATQMVIVKNKAGYIKVFYQLKNVGHSVAENVTFIPQIVSNERVRLNGMCDTPSDWKREMTDKNGGIVIFPEQGFTGSWPVPVPANSNGLELIGCLYYASPIDNRIHHTEIHYWILEKDSNGKVASSIKDGGTYDTELSMDIDGTHAD